MHRLSLVSIATVSTIALTQIASAADLPRKAPVYAPPPAPVFSWTGFYVGGNAGYGWGQRVNTTYVAPGGLNGFGDPDPISANGSGSLDPTGFVGGVQIGYNWQFAPTWVLGIEVDFQAFNLSDLFDRTIALPDFNTPLTQKSAPTGFSPCVDGWDTRLTGCWSTAPAASPSPKSISSRPTHSPVSSRVTPLSFRPIFLCFRHQDGMDGWWRGRICVLEQLVGQSRISFCRLGQHQRNIHASRSLLSTDSNSI